MERRRALKNILGYAIVLPALARCGQNDGSINSPLRAGDLSPEERAFLEQVRCWSYYAPFTSYDGLLQPSEEPRHDLDRELNFSALQRRSRRISGRRDDGTDNRTNFTGSQLEGADPHMRLKFWHDDSLSHERGHTLFLFAPYLEKLKAGDPVFVGTGMTQGHFHVVMLHT